MSIILRDDRSFGGTAYPAGTTLSLDGALEANLVAQGLATWAGQAPYGGGPTHPAQLAVDDRGHITGLVGSSGTAGFVDAGLFGASPDASAAVNTAAIQAALDVGGLVTLRLAGTYLINNTIYIGDHTHLVCGPDTVIKQSTGVSKTLFATKAFRDRADAPTVTVTWSSGYTATIEYPAAHGLTVADSIWTYGANQGVYNQVHRVHSVDSSTIITVVLPYMPTAAATGTIKAVKCTRGFSLIGGVFDYDYANNASATDFNVATILLGCAADFTVRDVRSVNAYKYAFLVGAARNYKIDNIWGDGLQGAASSEVIKTYGPACLGKVSRVDGRTTDDFMSIQPKEADAYSNYRWTYGDVFDLEYEDIRGSHSGGSGGVVVYLSDNEKCDGITVRKVKTVSSGASSSGCKITYGSGFTTGVAGVITLDHTVPLALTGATQFGISCGANVRQLNIELTRARPSTLTQIWFKQTAGTINQLNIALPTVDDSAWPSSSQYAFNISGAACNQINVMGGVTNTHSSYGRMFSLSGSTVIKQVNINGLNHMEGGVFMVVQASAANTILIDVSNSRFYGIDQLIQANSAVEVNLVNNVFDTTGTSVVRGNAAINCKITGSGNKFVSSALWTSANSATCDVYGFDLPIDVGATGINKTAGTYAFNTASGRGTLTQNRLVACNGTSWFQLDNPALVY